AEVADRRAAGLSGWEVGGVDWRADERCGADGRRCDDCADGGWDGAESDGGDEGFAFVAGMDGDGPDQRDGKCGWEFGLRLDDGGGSSGVGELEGVDGGGIDCDQHRSAGSGGVVFAGWSGERGGAAG